MNISKLRNNKISADAFKQPLKMFKNKLLIGFLKVQKLTF
jgi:hypothetical protein